MFTFVAQFNSTQKNSEQTQALTVHVAADQSDAGTCGLCVSGENDEQQTLTSCAVTDLAVGVTLLKPHNP